MRVRDLLSLQLAPVANQGKVGIWVTQTIRFFQPLLEAEFTRRDRWFQCINEQFSEILNVLSLLPSPKKAMPQGRLRLAVMTRASVGVCLSALTAIECTSRVPIRAST